MKRSMSIFAGLMLAMALSAAWANETEEGDSALHLGEVVVTATKSSINKRETGASITVITEKEIEQKGNRMVIDALKGVPGLTITQQGSAGGISSVFMRGARGKNISVLIDGVRVNDPSSPDGAYDFANLTADNIERIEVVRGAQSTLYGSDAAAGVINIITKKGYGRNTLTLRAEGGSFSTFREYAGFHGGDEKSNYSFSLSRTDTAGISQMEKPTGATKALEKDSYENTTATANIGGAVMSDVWLSIAMRYSDALMDVDGLHSATGKPVDDPNYVQRTRQFSMVTKLEQDIAQWWSHSIIGNYMSVLRNGINDADDVDPGFSHDYYQGTQRHFEWRHKIVLFGISEVTGGIEYQDEMMSSLSDYSGSPSSFGEEKAYSVAYYLQNHLKLYERIFLIAGLRLTDHEVFGKHWNYQLSGSAIIPVTETRLKGNYTTGFKAPLLYQLYVDNAFAKGSEDLKPEESKGFDIGLEQPIFSGNLILEGSFFRNKFKNLITAVMGFPSQYVNKKEAETEGYESSLTFTPIHELRVTGAYTYIKESWEGESDERMVRVPKHQGSVIINLFVLNRINLNASMIYVGEREDAIPGSWPSVQGKMDDYLLYNAAVSVNFMEKFQVFARCENITDEHYQDVMGYKRPGRAFYGGVKGTF